MDTIIGGMSSYFRVILGIFLLVSFLDQAASANLAVNLLERAVSNLNFKALSVFFTSKLSLLKISANTNNFRIMIFQQLQYGR